MKMLSQENNETFNGYKKTVLKEHFFYKFGDENKTNNSTYVGILDHENYTDLCVSNDRRLAQHCEYSDTTDARVFVVAVDDEHASVVYEGNTLNDVINKVNSEDWGEGSPNFTEKRFIDWCKNTFADRDWSQGYFIIQRSGDTFDIIAEPSSGSVNIYTADDFANSRADDPGDDMRHLYDDSANLRR
jgi:hypothetical protein